MQEVRKRQRQKEQYIQRIELSVRAKAETEVEVEADTVVEAEAKAVGAEAGKVVEEKAQAEAGAEAGMGRESLVFKQRRTPPLAHLRSMQILRSRVDVQGLQAGRRGGGERAEPWGFCQRVNPGLPRVHPLPVPGVHPLRVRRCKNPGPRHLCWRQKVPTHATQGGCGSTCPREVPSKIKRKACHC